MTNEEMWGQLVDRHGWKEEDVVKLRARGLKNLIDQAWEEGRTRGHKERDFIDRMKTESKTSGKGYDPMSLFNGILGQ